MHHRLPKKYQRFPTSVPDSEVSEQHRGHRSRSRTHANPSYHMPPEYRPLSDTLTEAEGLARNRFVTGRYAGSF
ncbi:MULTISPECIES: hypothetical protein [Hymenobacter]|uniref:Uncharacterized protein n=1 Tax=Hymenobacter jejuensis TaxID=2502781 RepID=A0A5B8A1P4_9BACT|nr:MULTISPECIES: hypothetical protein [Hymenobacter]MBC6990545.1 hypothetical protein [Hymenobacter sp. BT491]QDA61037.1 hypothetical protein FHG12_13400 [Hymenobacter jejuensis]